jgi:hypothetical protein
VQGFLARLGVTTSYVYVNAFLYSVYGQGGGEKHIDDAPIADYRNRWLTALAAGADLDAVVTLGRLADKAYAQSPLATGGRHRYANMRHPTYPESASASGSITKAEAMARLCESWNAALEVLDGKVTPDVATGAPRRYGTALTRDDLAGIPEIDVPAGLPAWMRGLSSWARRTGDTPESKRATITVTVPADARP